MSENGSEQVEAPEADSVDAPTSDPIRNAIARRVSRSNREIPHYHVQHEIDLSRSRAWLDHHNESLAPADRVARPASSDWRIADCWPASFTIAGSDWAIPLVEVLPWAIWMVTAIKMHKSPTSGKRIGFG